MRIALTSLFSLLVGCAALPPGARVDRGAEALFAARGVRGAFVLLHPKTGAMTVVDPTRALRRYIPASTFKVANTLVAADAGIVKDPRFSLRWDGRKRWLAAWNRDHDLASAMRESVVWFYQELARRIGLGRMKDGLARLEYGNQSLEGGVDRFWLDGGLRVSPLEQVRFLARLFDGSLPLRPEALALTRRVLPTLGDAGGRVWRGKTGLHLDARVLTGWLVGAVEGQGGPWLYALLVRAAPSARSSIFALRFELARALLTRAGVLR